jgi:hypothetical protein
MSSTGFFSTTNLDDGAKKNCVNNINMNNDFGQILENPVEVTLGDVSMHSVSTSNSLNNCINENTQSVSFVNYYALKQNNAIQNLNRGKNLLK